MKKKDLIEMIMRDIPDHAEIAVENCNIHDTRFHVRKYVRTTETTDHLLCVLEGDTGW